MWTCFRKKKWGKRPYLPPFLDVIASPSTYPCQSVGSFRFGDCYCISELCELVKTLFDRIPFGHPLPFVGASLNGFDCLAILLEQGTALHRLSLFPGTKGNFCQTTFSQTGGFIRGLWSIWIFLHVIGFNSKIWLNFWKLVEILKLGQNSEMGLKFCNFIKRLKFVEDDEEDLQLLNYHEKL